MGIGLVSAALGDVFVDVRHYDGTTPLALADPNSPNMYRNIMVGTKLGLLVSSDTPGYWTGGLLIAEDDWERGTLDGRGYDPSSETFNYRGSCLDAVGEKAVAAFVQWPVTIGPDTVNYIGFDLISHRESVAGEWFVLDYYAERVGRCDVGLYDYSVGVDAPPTQSLSFNHVRSRDFNGDKIVNFMDLATLARSWQPTADPVGDSDLPCDINADRRVDMSDIELFAEYWLERTDCNDPTAEPNTPAPPP
jgi:hypothetical protein